MCSLHLMRADILGLILSKYRTIFNVENFIVSVGLRYQNCFLCTFIFFL